ncbi:hypothetical protein [Actinocorallia aurantiaca]|uniref:Serine/threonine protein kinase n=1 Tax=Actinocorallia aurantiaca TaxID=46204 RepID=A0ABP6GGF6_9ACTN
MKQITPLLTLAAGVIVGGVVYGLDVRAYKDDGPPEAAAPAASSPAVAPPPTAGSAEPSASPSGAPAADGSYAGYAQVKGQRVPLAITIRAGRAIAYLCDGQSLEAWFKGAVDTGLNLVGKNGAALTGRSASGGIAGEVTVAGGTYAYTLQEARKPSGLYRATGPTREAIGWIVQAGGQVGLATSPDGTSRPAPVLDPATLTATVDGAQITAAPADPEE